MARGKARSSGARHGRRRGTNGRLGQRTGEGLTVPCPRDDDDDDDNDDDDDDNDDDQYELDNYSYFTQRNCRQHSRSGGGDDNCGCGSTGMVEWLVNVRLLVLGVTGDGFMLRSLWRSDLFVRDPSSDTHARRGDQLDFFSIHLDVCGSRCAPHLSSYLS